MLFQEDLFFHPTPITSERFLSRLAGVLTARSGSSYSDALKLAERAIDGTVCACCGSRVKVYKRGITVGQVATLRDLCARFSVGTVFESKQINSRGGDYAKLAAFDLLEKCGESMWKITPNGRRFASGDSPASRFAYFFLGELVGLSVESAKVTLHGHRFRLDSISPHGVEMVFLR
jgi:hypothetical protein